MHPIQNVSYSTAIGLGKSLAGNKYDREANYAV